MPRKVLSSALSPRWSPPRQATTLCAATRLPNRRRFTQKPISELGEPTEPTDMGRRSSLPVQARTSELFPEPLAPTTSTNGRSALPWASMASNTSPIALVLQWKIGARSKSKKFSPRNGFDFHRRTFVLKAFVRLPALSHFTRKIAEMSLKSSSNSCRLQRLLNVPTKSPRCSPPNAQRKRRVIANFGRAAGYIKRPTFWIKCPRVFRPKPSN